MLAILFTFMSIQYLGVSIMKFSLSAFSILMLFSFLSYAETVNVYFGTSGKDGDGIYTAKFNTATGKLSKPVLAANVRNSGFLAWSPDKSKLYSLAALEGGAGVVGYKVAEDGSLKEFTSSLINDGGGAHISVHPSGKFLLTAQYGGGSVAFFPLNAAGELGKSIIHEHEGGSKVVANRQDSPHPHWTGYSPDGKFAFVPDLGTDCIHIYKVNSENSGITKHGLAKSIPGGGPRHMRFSADGKFIYLLNELALSVSTFKYNSATGEATLLTVEKALSEEVKAKETFNSSAEILIHPNGKFVWSSNRGNDSITAYKADPATGKLTFTESEHIRGAWPRNINIDPSAKWILAAGQHSNTISVFQINQENGELAYFSMNVVNVPGPLCIVFRK